MADVSYSRWVRKRMYFDISITHNTLHHRGQSRGHRGEETSFILTPAQLHSINIVKLRQGSGKDRQGLAKDGPARVRQGSARIGRGWPIRQKALKLPCLELTLK